MARSIWKGPFVDGYLLKKAETSRILPRTAARPPLRARLTSPATRSRHAAQALRQALISDLAERYDVPPDQIRFIEGLAQVNSHTVPLDTVAVQMLAEGIRPMAEYTYWAPATKPLGQGGDMHFAFSFAAQAAEIEVNTHTGEVKVLRVIVANDVGYAINPLGLARANRGRRDDGHRSGLD